jgi:tetratricopeptide (TPR) repeat protein
VKRYNLIKMFLVIHFFCAACLALNSPISNPTVPQSSGGSGLVRSPNPINTSGNLIITGNVAGNSQFRGLVPYHAPTDFEAPLGTNDLGAFLRSSVPINTGIRQVGPQPYYLPSRTVSSMVRGSGSGLITYTSVRDSGSGLITYTSIRQNQVTGEYEYVVTPAIAQVPTGISPLYEYDLTRPLSYNASELERVVNYNLTRSELVAALKKAGENEQEKTKETQSQENQNIPLKAEPAKPLERTLKPEAPLQPGQINEETAKTAKAPKAKSVFEQMLEDLNSAKAAEAKKEKIKDENKTGEIEEPNAGGRRSELSTVSKETATAMKDIHKSFAIEANDKFNYYMKSAEDFLKQGKYYRAADSYTLASIYKPSDPLAYAGRSHALFASGEYMSSAYFLTMAINMFPQYVNFKIDLNAMIPDKDRLESRIADIKTWIEKTNSPELNFLLAYIYYQLGNQDLATKAIDTAEQKMPNSQAVKALKQVIEQK